MDKIVDQNCDDKLKIVNRNREYHVSKKFICSSVPYFEKMFCCDLLESRENKVTLDFDEHSFDSILNWIHTGLFIMQMDYVISFYDTADYLMMNDRLLRACYTYFHDIFTARHLSVVLSQVTKVSKLINSGSMENLICRYFLQIVNTYAFLDYPTETVKAILELDLMIYSEYQIFESIMKWVGDNEFRAEAIPQFLYSIRWSFMDPLDISKIRDDDYIKALPIFDVIISSNVQSNSNRTKQNFFISIHRMDASKLIINVFDKDFFCLPIGVFTQDDSMSLEFVHGEHISDILFDSGSKGIRIDWVKKVFRWLDFKVAGKTYYSQFVKFIDGFSFELSSFSCYLDDQCAKVPKSIPAEELFLLEFNGAFILIGKTVEKKWFGIFPVKHKSWFNYYEDHQHSFRATILNKTVYILTKELELARFDMETRYFFTDKPLIDRNLAFDDLILTSHQTNDDKIILVSKSSGKVYVLCNDEEEWVEKYRFINVDVGSSVYANGLIAFTSTFLSMKNIKPLFTQNSSFN